MKTTAILMALAGSLAWGQAALAPPRIGFVQDQTGALYFLGGLAGNFALGNAIGHGVISSSFSGTAGFFKTESVIVLIDQYGKSIHREGAPPGPALFAFTNNGEPALVYLAGNGTLYRWSARGLTRIPFDGQAIAGEVLSIAQPSPSQAGLLVRRDKTVWLVEAALASGVVESERRVGAFGSPALLLNDGSLLFTDARGIVLEGPGGVKKHFPARAAEHARFQRIGAEWVQLASPHGRQFAIRLESGREQLYQVPEARP